MTAPVVAWGSAVGPVGNRGGVTRLRWPATTDPFLPCGVIVTVIAPTSPGPTRIGVPNPSEVGSTAIRNGSSVDEVTAGSNPAVRIDAVIVVSPAGGPASLNGPSSLTLVNHRPCVTNPFCSPMLATDTV